MVKDLDGQSLTTLGPSSLQCLLTALGAHPFKEAVSPFPLYLVRMVCGIRAHNYLGVQYRLLPSIKSRPN